MNLLRSQTDTGFHPPHYLVNPITGRIHDIAENLYRQNILSPKGDQTDVSIPSAPMPISTKAVPPMVTSIVQDSAPVPVLETSQVLPLCDSQITTRNLSADPVSADSFPSVITPTEIDRPENVLESSSTDFKISADHQITSVDFSSIVSPSDNVVNVSTDPALMTNLGLPKKPPYDNLSVLLQKQDDNLDNLPLLIDSSDDDNVSNFRLRTSKIRKEPVFAVVGPPMIFPDDALLFGYDSSGTSVIINSIQMDNIANYLQFWPPKPMIHPGYHGFQANNDAVNRHNTSATVEINWSPVPRHRHRLRHRERPQGLRCDVTAAPTGT